MAKEIFSKDPEKFIAKLAETLNEIPEFQTPEWAMFVKSGMSRERPPADADFWFVRSASILRQLYIKGVVGVGKLRTRYGSRKDRGGRPDKFYKSGGKIIRVILQQAEAAGLVEKVTRLQHGRRLTQAGRDLLDSIEVEEKIMSFDAGSVIVNNIEIANEDASFEESGESDAAPLEVAVEEAEPESNTVDVKDKTESKENKEATSKDVPSDTKGGNE